MDNGLLEKIKEAEMLLVGLGEEFDDLRLYRQAPGYKEGRDVLEASEKSYLIPLYDAFYRRQLKSRVKEVLEKLAGMIGERDYFVITTSLNDELVEIPWKEGRFAAPCGGIRRKQCIHRCADGLQEVTGEERQLLFSRMQAFCTQAMGKSPEDGKGHPMGEEHPMGEKHPMKNLPSLAGFQEEDAVLGICTKCGEPLLLNNIYTEFYDENGYLDMWNKYRTWLQGTLGRRLLILELGVGMQCPSVIRWPFEKTAFYNQKAYLYRVHETLCQLPGNLQEKGVSIPENSIDWLQSLC